MDQTDRARFDRAISKLLYSLNGTAKASPTIIGAYWSVLKGHDWPAVATAMTKALNESTGHVSPAKLAELARPDPEQQRAAIETSRAIQLQHRMDAADRAKEDAGRRRWGTALWESVEFHQVKDVANMEYGRRCSGQLPGGLRFPTPQTKGYDGKFDYMAVVNAAPRPVGKNPDKHAQAWEYFWQLLKEEFGAYFDDSRNEAHRPF